MVIRLAAIALLAVAGAELRGEAGAQVAETGPAVFQRSAPRKEAPPADLARTAARLPAAARHDLGPLSQSERESLRSRDARGKLAPKRPAVRVGITRPLPAPVGFDASVGSPAAGTARIAGGGLLERADDGGLLWSAAFTSDGAGALRLHLREASLPPGSRAWVFSAAGEAHGPYLFDSGAGPEGFWTNTVFASEIFLEVRLPAGADASSARITVAGLAHIEHPSFAPNPSGATPAAGELRPKVQTCFVDASCVTTSDFSNIEDARHAVAQLEFVDDGGVFVCTGGLLNTEPATFVPYLLTANHCFDNPAAAASLEAFWQYRTATCDGPFPNKALFPRTLGSTLLATGETSDFTFVRLSQDPPDDSVFLGWTTDDYSHAGGTLLYRLSHPNGDPQFYTLEEISAIPTPVSCGDAPQGNYIYTKDLEGGTGGGSSGSPVYLESLQVVGQELGGCGNNVEDDCDVVANSTLDGAFRVTFPFVDQWLAPGGGCVPGSTTLCLNGGRFRVTVAWETQGGASGPGQAVPLTNDSGYFYFFNPANIELVVKVLNACTGFQRHWVFAGGLTNVHTLLTVEDTQTGAEKVYENPLGTAFLPIQDTNAFPCP